MGTTGKSNTGKKKSVRGRGDNKQRISAELQKEIHRRYKAGERQDAIARDVGFSRQSIANVVEKFEKPEKVKARKESNYRKRLTEVEYEEFKKIIETTVPADHGYKPALSKWNVESGIWVAEKRFGKKVAVAMVTNLVKPYMKRRNIQEIGDPKPEPPEPFDITKVDPELAKDKSFVEYCQSPIGRQVAWRTYEAALKEWEQRNPDQVERKAPEPKKKVVKKVAGKRVGKHAGGTKGSAAKKTKRKS